MYCADDDACRRILLEHEREREGKLRDIAVSLTQPRARRMKSRTSEPTRDVVDAANAAHQDKLVRDESRNNKKEKERKNVNSKAVTRMMTIAFFVVA